MADPLAVPLINGYRHGFASIELKMGTQIFRGFKSIEYSRTRNREMVMGNSPDPISKTRGENEYEASCELYLAEYRLFQAQLGAGYGDKFFSVMVTYGETGFDTVTDELLGCTLDSTEMGGSQGPDALTVTVDLNPIKIRLSGVDDLEFPLAPPPEG